MVKDVCLRKKTEHWIKSKNASLPNQFINPFLMMENLNKCKAEIISELSKMTYMGDVGDLGNLIGIVIAKYFDEYNDKETFISGLNHGISLTDGTHG